PGPLAAGGARSAAAGRRLRRRHERGDAVVAAARWAGSARAVFSDVSAATDAPAMARGMLEGIAGSYRRVSDELESAS
ncbi:hypothetical protein LAN13_25100, partial [Mycobacterium tuberculosis]|nr:hypothetical protein [Mycobacterium tuberculosis]